MILRFCFSCKWFIHLFFSLCFYWKISHILYFHIFCKFIEFNCSLLFKNYCCGVFFFFLYSTNLYRTILKVNCSLKTSKIEILVHYTILVIFPCFTKSWFFPPLTHTRPLSSIEVEILENGYFFNNFLPLIDILLHPASILFGNWCRVGE